MATSLPTHPTAHTVASLLPKLQDADSDFRFMSLNDLFTILSTANSSILLNDYHTAARAVDGILKTLDDQNGEVQNLAIKCLGPLVTKIPSGLLPPLIEKLSNLRTENSIDSSIPSTALRTVVTHLPRPVPGVPSTKVVEDAYQAISRVLIPRLVGYIVIPHGQKASLNPPPGMLELDANKGVDADAIDVMIELARCFGPVLQESEVASLESAVSDILDDLRAGSVVKKRATVALSVLAVYFTDGLLSSFISNLIESFRDPHLTPSRRRLLITIAGAMARSIPHKFGPYLKTLAPFVLSAVSEAELLDQTANAAEDVEVNPVADEVREAALAALESFFDSCNTEMRFYLEETIHAALFFLKYDPNFNQDEDNLGLGDVQSKREENEEEDFDMEEDFEEDGGLSDDDDISWKVRRCAAKLVHTLISSRASGDLSKSGTLYDRIAPALLDRFKEREENVRLEILATMGYLIRKTGERTALEDSNAIDDTRAALVGPAQSRKRRRGGSDASIFDLQPSPSWSTDANPLGSSMPPFGPHAGLSKLSPAIVASVTRLLKVNSQSTRQASITLLKDIVAVQRGGLSDDLGQITDQVADAVVNTGAANSGSTLATSTAGAASATGSSLRIEALSLAAAIAEPHHSAILRPFIAKLVPGLKLAVKDKFYKISSEALHVVEQFVRALTPPRSQTQDSAQQELLETLYETVIERINANDADGEVRQQAVHALGVLLAKTSGIHSTRYLSQAKRFTALEVLGDRLKNETTRMAAIQAIGEVASHASVKNDFFSPWVGNVALELGSQLRKANRSLRLASLAAIKNLVINSAGHAYLEAEIAASLIHSLSPLLTANDLHLLGPTLIVLASLIRVGDNKVIDQGMAHAICSLALAQLSGAVLDALLILVKTIGEQGVGTTLMQGLLKNVGVNGDPAVVGKVIGTLLVGGGPKVGVKLDDFAGELQGAQDDKRKCLALSVLGEAGLRLGQSSPLTPNIFVAHFKSKSDQVPLAAAVALGRAGAGNVRKYLPPILQALGEAGSSQYLLLHSIKEILQHVSDASTDISPYSRQIWEKLLQTSQTEDNRAVGAECIGRLTIIDPKAYLPSLQAYLKDKKASIRGMAIQAIRYALTDTDDTYDSLFQPAIIDMLTTMLSDSDRENARLALTTLISAAHNKPYLILPYLGQLLPPVMKESVIKPELIHEVQMGPFKHKVDDGLELRKSAYETLYALMETAFSRINSVDFFDRVIAGLEDEHDIQVLCNLMLTKLIVLERDETMRRLDQIAERFRVTLSFKPKENAVKQEIEKADETSKGVLKVSILLNAAFPSAGGPAASGQHQIWRNYWEWVRRDMGLRLRGVEEEMAKDE